MHIFWARGPKNYTIIWHPWFSPNRLTAEGQFLEWILWLEAGSLGQDIDRLAHGLSNVILFFILTIRLFKAIWVENLFRILVSAIRSHCGMTLFAVIQCQCKSSAIKSRIVPTGQRVKCAGMWEQKGLWFLLCDNVGNLLEKHYSD